MHRLLAIIICLLTLLFSTRSQGQIIVKEILQDSIPIYYKGKAIDSYRFKDKSGDHIFLVTKTEDTSNFKITIAASKYTSKDGKYAKVWNIKDSANEILLYYKYTKIIDINKDSMCETIFIYQLNPDYGEGSDWKVVLHYKNQKYVLRAHVPELDYDKYSILLDKAFDTIPNGIKKYVTSYWKKIVKEQNLKAN